MINTDFEDNHTMCLDMIFTWDKPKAFPASINRCFFNNSTLDLMYVIASKARGEPVLWSSVNEGILIPLISIIFSKIPFIIGGAVIVEHVFNWPGMGRLAFQSTLDRDLPVLIVIAFLSVLCVRGGMLVKELALHYFNPGEK